jgi:hypothetical protein
MGRLSGASLMEPDPLAERLAGIDERDGRTIPCTSGNA